MAVIGSSPGRVKVRDVGGDVGGEHWHHIGMRADLNVSATWKNTLLSQGILRAPRGNRTPNPLIKSPGEVVPPDVS
jgi:hypothetical protein